VSGIAHHDGNARFAQDGGAPASSEQRAILKPQLGYRVTQVAQDGAHVLMPIRLIGVDTL
jgi:hypothetical protein